MRFSGRHRRSSPHCASTLPSRWSRISLAGRVGALVACSLWTSGLVRAQAFETTAFATILHTGNSLSLSGQTNLNGPGIASSGHTLICADTATTDLTPANPGNPWFAGTTFNWTLDGSSATLSPPPQSNILRADLIWAGSYSYGPEDLSAFLDAPVTLTTSAGRTFEIAPDPSYSTTLNLTATGGFQVAFYVRGANVTNRVRNAGNSTWTVGGVPVTQHEINNSLNGGGWALFVVAESAATTCRSISMAVRGEWVEPDLDSTLSFENLSTPAAGAVAGRVVVATIEGDASSPGDSLEIEMPGTSNWLALSGPNNPAVNFFASQINGSGGLLDTTGTFGSRNHDAASGTNISGGRQGWDLTAAALSSAGGHLANAQSSTSLRFSTAGDAFVTAWAGLEADAIGPCPAPGTSLFADGLESGDTDAWAAFTP